MDIWQPDSKDRISFEWAEPKEDSKNIYFALNKQNPEQALRLRIGETETTMATDEALTLLEWLEERRATLFELLKQLSFE